MPLRRLLAPLLLVGAVVLAGAPVSQAQVGPPTSSPVAPASGTTTAPPTTTPDTRACPYRSAPAAATDASEVPAPGATAPAPLPVPDPAVGGLGSCDVTVPAGSAPLPAGLTASGWVLADLDTGEVLAAKDPHGRYRPASTIKLLTASLALSRLDLDAVVTGTQDDADAEGSEVGIGPGGRYTVRDLLLGLLLASGNDAAHALAVQLGGVSQTVDAANELARSLGATDTRVTTPSGLDAPGTSTSPYDLALFLRHALTVPGFAELDLTRQTLFPGYADKPPFLLSNDNQLIQTYPGVLGAKNGFTDDARQTFAGAAERGGRRLVVTLMRGERAPLLPYEQAAALLDWGFAQPPSTAGVGTLVDGPVTPASSSSATATPTVTATPSATPGAAAAAPSTPTGGSRAGEVAGVAAAVAVVLAVAALLLARRRRRLR